jgi:tetratricopeptide (TPR) repeat protein
MEWIVSYQCRLGSGQANPTLYDGLLRSVAKLKDAVCPVLYCLLLLCVGCQPHLSIDDAKTDYQQELTELKAQITQAQTDYSKQPSEKNAFRLLFHHYSLAGLTGDYNDYSRVQTSLQHIETQRGVSPQLLQFSANFNFKMHRLEAAKADLIKLGQIDAYRNNEILKADIALQQGQYAIAEQAYEAISQQNPAWDNLARLAYFKLHTGKVEQADQLYQQAQNKLSIKQMRHYAWLELQRGIIDLELQHYQQALEHYLLADQAYSGYWLIHEHIAEVYGLMDRQDEAIALYEKIIQQTGNPEFISVLATLYQTRNRSKATRLFALADELFARQYQLFPEAAVGHYLESLLARERIDDRVLDYALRNFQWRSNAQSEFLLARSYQKTGNDEQAHQRLNKVAQTVWRSRAIEEMIKEMNR